MRQGSNPLQIKLLSIVIPAYKQEKTIIKDVKSVEKSLRALGYKYEIIIVIDGILDKTYSNVLKIKSKKIKVFSFQKNNGKGHAVRFGMLQAKGDVVGFIDAGMDINPRGLAMLLQHMDWYKADIIVGSKLHPASKIHYPIQRKILSWGYRYLTRKLFGFKIRDTQVGLKFFKRRVIRNVLPRLLVKTYAFDIEILAVAYSLGYKRIYEAPVEINFKKTQSSISSKGLWKIIFLMLLDTAAVFYRLKIIRYYSISNKKLYKSRFSLANI